MALEVTRASPRLAPGAPDPDVKVPESVRRQAANADAIQQQITGQPAPTPIPPTPVPTTPVPTVPVGDTPPAPLANGDVPPGPTEAGEQTWEQRYRSLEGRLRDDRRLNAERITQLERELATRPVTAPQTPPAPTKLVTPQEETDYGTEFLDMVGRKAMEIVAPYAARIEQLQSHVGATANRVAVSDNDRLHQHMNAVIPDWQAVNNSPEFLAWLRLPDIYSGAIRQQLVQDAWNRGDATRVEAFFRGFLAEQTALGLRPPVTPAAVPVQPQPNGSAVPAAQPRVTLESLAAPGRARVAPPVPAAKHIWTTADITQFYSDVKLGKFKGREQDIPLIEHDLMTAQFEGRILTPNPGPAPPGGYTR
jgi:hypothetical protein